MNLFRSEEHARNWHGFVEDSEENLLPIADWVECFSGEFHNSRLRPDYMTWLTERRRQQQAAR